jgi:hypothetical protein
MHTKPFKTLALLILLTAACVAGTTQQLTAQEILDKSVTEMRGLAGFRFDLVRSGASAFLDPGHTVSFREADGIFVSPDKVQATVKVILPGLAAEVSIIGIGDQEWETNVFTGAWELVPPEYAFQPAVLFDPQGGIQQALQENLTDLELVGIEELEEAPGLGLYHLRGKMDGAQVQSITLGLIDPQPLSVDLWISPNSFDLYSVVIVDPADEGETEGTTWQMHFWDFDKVIEINPPI